MTLHGLWQPSLFFRTPAAHEFPKGARAFSPTLDRSCSVIVTATDHAPETRAAITFLAAFEMSKRPAKVAYEPPRTVLLWWMLRR